MSFTVLSALSMLLFILYGNQFVSADTKIKLTKFKSSFQCSKNFLVAKEDYTIIQFEASGVNLTLPFDSIDGPRFFYSRNNTYIFACSGLNNITGTCTDRTGIPDSCSCQIQDTGGYLLTFNKTADILDSKEYVFLTWAKPPENSSLKHEYVYPEVRETCPELDGFSDVEMALICVAPIVGSLLLVCVICCIQKIRKRDIWADKNHAPNSSFYSLEYTRLRMSCSGGERDEE